MIRINLLPFRVSRKKENIRRQIVIYISSVILVALVLVYYNGSLNRKIQDLDTRVAKTKKELATYQAKIKEIEKIKRELDILNKKIAVIKKLQASRRGAVHLLDSMGRMVIAKRMWFTNFQEKGIDLIINGIAVDNKTIADFMTRLEGSYANVNLTNIKQIKRKNIYLKSFQITCRKSTSKKAAKSGPSTPKPTRSKT
ncbi:MAG: PilN domain-containing protein [Deltaproteobacteria bacterium]|nr:PilN domain-containing protein [Deltaproteobacteria bacterium]